MDSESEEYNDKPLMIEKPHKKRQLEKIRNETIKKQHQTAIQAWEIFIMEDKLEKNEFEKVDQ